MTEKYISYILRELSEDHKELLFLCAVRLFSSTRIAAIRGQTDRNIRKVRGTMLKRYEKAASSLTGKGRETAAVDTIGKGFFSR